MISGALVTIGSDLGPAELSSGQKVSTNNSFTQYLTQHRPQEFVTSATTLGALLGGLAAGAMSDWTGRKPVLVLADIIFIGGAIGQAVCHDVWSMVSACYLVLFTGRELIPLKKTDWMPFVDRGGGRPCFVHRPSIYPRALSHAIARTHGRD